MSFVLKLQPNFSLFWENDFFKIWTIINRINFIHGYFQKKKKKEKKNTEELEFLCMSLNFVHKIDAGTFLRELLLTLSCRMLKISQMYFKNLAVVTPQDFKIKFGNFSTLCMTVLSNLALVFKCLKKQHFAGVLQNWCS